jgi:hypothetical protein
MKEILGDWEGKQVEVKHIGGSILIGTVVYVYDNFYFYIRLRKSRICILLDAANIFSIENIGR